MVYFDNAATTYPKPRSVISAVSAAMTEYGANPGRAGHKLSLKTAEAVYDVREKCAEIFGAEPENVIFTPNCTYALNFAIKGLLKNGSHIVCSDIEHNAVLRPVYACMKDRGASCTFVQTGDDDEAVVNGFEKSINEKTKAVVCTAAGNVTGRILPVKRIAGLCRRKNICFIVDAAQGAGVLPLSLSDGINIICAAGHKGLYGPMGTGLFITDGKFRLETIIEGGTGSNSKDPAQPVSLPDRFESGTINTPGVVALGAGLDFVKSRGVGAIYAHEAALCEKFFREVSAIPNVKLYSDAFDGRFAPVIPFNIGDIPSERLSALLSGAGFCLRGGFHCAYPAHKKIGTGEQGAVRFSPSVFNSASEVSALTRFIKKIAKST